MYAELLAQLLGSSDKTLVISYENVTTAAIRQGLKAALTKFNQQMELCDLPTVKGNISVSNPTSQGHITIKIVTSAPQAKFQFTIVEEDPNGS